MDVGKRIIELRKQQNLTTNRLATLSGISQSHLREVELGNKNPTVEFLSYICDGLHIRLADFFASEESSIDPVLASALKELSPTQQRKLADFLDAMIHQDV